MGLKSAVIRVDASAAIGIGHVMRCLTLAEALRKRDVAVMFVCREHDGHMCDRIVAQNIPVTRLSVSYQALTVDDSRAYAAWVGAPWWQDAEQTRAAIEASGFRPDWAIVDHYGLDHRWESVLRRSVDHIMVIDDLADRRHDCDLLLDQNLVADLSTRYADRVPETCVTLLGPDWALLQPLYAELRERTPPREGAIHRVLVSYGGADMDNLTGRTLAAILRLERTDIEVHVVTAADAPHAAAVREQVAKKTNVHLHSGLCSLAPLIAHADLAIGACGSSVWERLCLGLPSLVVTLADNQRHNAAELHRRGLVQWLGHYDEVSERMLEQVLRELISRGLNESWSLKCRSVVDGKGLDRVCTALTLDADTPLHVRPARMADEPLLLAWANDATTRRNAFNPRPIAPTTHHEWLRNCLGDLNRCRLFIVESAVEVAVGQVRFELLEGGGQSNQCSVWEVHYAVAAQFRGRGVGRRALEVALCRLRDEQRGGRVFGKVKASNQASCRVFESLGFKRNHSAQDVVFVYERSL
jgi:UDP-2,4-diacetamido-2,4,6-trideoxy-beta-L-altropyranose hydrolase